jgi:hypothetical protein
MKKRLLIITVAIGLFSCNSNSDKNKVVSSIAAEEQSDAELKKEVEAIEAEEKAKLEAEIASRTTISFEKLIHDFGKVKADTDNRYKFKFTNTGNKPLIISDVKASCGCTTPYKPEKPILPGKSDVIEVNFHPKASQAGDVSKTITVESNIEGKLSELQIKAFVEN